MARDRGQEVREWVEKAEQDFFVATLLARGRAIRAPDAACFHAQQCAEKYLKGYLVLHGITFPKTHDLERLLELAVKEDPLTEVLHRDMAYLKPYSVEIRYPGDEATPAEARAAVNRMSRVREFLRKKLGLPGRPGRSERKRRPA